MRRPFLSGFLFLCFGLAAFGQTQSSRLGLSLKDQALQAANEHDLKAIAARKTAAILPNSSVHLLTMQIRGTYEVLLPPDYEKSNRQYPVCVLLHGNGDNESRFARLADAIGREGVIYIAVRAPYGSNGSADSYTAWPPDHVDDNFMSSVRSDYVEWIFNVVRAVQKEYRVRPRQVLIHGFSQGGQFAMLSALLHPDLVKSVFVQSGSAVPDSYFTPASLAAVKKTGVTVWISQGDRDTAVLPEKSQKLAAQLKNAGIPVTMRLLPGVHTITKEMVEFAKEWKKQQVGK